MHGIVLLLLSLQLLLVAVLGLSDFVLEFMLTLLCPLNPRPSSCPSWALKLGGHPGFVVGGTLWVILHYLHRS